MAKCMHGAERARRTNGPDIAFACQESTCACCGTIFYYIDEDMYSEYVELERVWEPKDQCEECGGRYVRRHFGSVEVG
jgi:hypothetical protein